MPSTSPTVTLDGLRMPVVLPKIGISLCGLSITSYHFLSIQLNQPAESISLWTAILSHYYSVPFSCESPGGLVINSLIPPIFLGSMLKTRNDYNVTHVHWEDCSANEGGRFGALGAYILDEIKLSNHVYFKALWTSARGL
jgi:hypothetical protein